MAGTYRVYFTTKTPSKIHRTWFEVEASSKADAKSAAKKHLPSDFPIADNTVIKVQFTY